MHCLQFFSILTPVWRERRRSIFRRGEGFFAVVLSGFNPLIPSAITAPSLTNLSFFSLCSRYGLRMQSFGKGGWIQIKTTTKAWVSNIFSLWKRGRQRYRVERKELVESALRLKVPKHENFSLLFEKDPVVHNSPCMCYPLYNILVNNILLLGKWVWFPKCL